MTIKNYQQTNVMCYAILIRLINK